MSRLKLTGVPAKELKKRRMKDVVAPTFNKLGIVVPYDRKTELGYRPLPLNNSESDKVVSIQASDNTLMAAYWGEGWKTYLDPNSCLFTQVSVLAKVKLFLV